MPVGGAIAAVGTVAAGGMVARAQSKAADRAAGAVENASAGSNALQREIYYDQRDLLEPTARAGAQAKARQMLMQGFTKDEVRAFLASQDAAFAGGGRGAAPAPGTPLSYPLYDASGNLVSTDALRPSQVSDFRSRGMEVYDSNGRPLGYGPQTQTPAPTFSPGANLDQGAWVDDWSYEASSPSYDFRFDEGQRALERSQAANNNFFSGDTHRAITRYGQDFASTEFENDFRRFGTLAGSGEEATGTIVNVAGNYGQQAGANIARAGDARASGYINAGNAQANFWGNTVPGAIGTVYGMGSNAGWWGGKK